MQNIYIYNFSNSFRYRGSYFKLVNKGSQILWIRCRRVLLYTVLLKVVYEGVKIRRSKTSHKVSSEVLCRVVCVGVKVRRDIKNIRTNFFFIIQKRKKYIYE